MRRGSTDDSDGEWSPPRSRLWDHCRCRVWPWWPNRDAGDACGIASGPAADPTTSPIWWVRPMAPVPVTLPAALRDHGVNSLPADLALIRKFGSEPINEAGLAVIDDALPL